MNLKNSIPVKSLLIFWGVIMTTSLIAADINWTGTGDGTSWEDPANWDTGIVPGSTDNVFISVDATVSISTNTEVAKVLLTDNAVLTITTTGQLSLPNDIDDDIIRLENNATLINSGVISLTGRGRNTIEAINASSLINGGTITVSQSRQEVLYLRDNASFLNHENGEMIILSSDDDGIDIHEYAVITNYGDISIANIDYDGLELNDNSKLYNYGNISISSIDNDSAISIDHSGTILDNYGTIEIENVTGNGYGIRFDDGVFTNYASGNVIINNIIGEGISVESDGLAYNYGSISIVLNSETSEIDHGIIIRSEGFLSNEGLLEITNNSSSYAIELRENDAAFVNEDCGEIYIFSDSQIELEPNTTFTNNGFLSTAFTGINTNFGAFTNDGQIIAPNGFPTSPNAVIEGSDVPTPWFTSTIGNAGTSANDFDYLNCDAAFVVTGGSNNVASYHTDNIAFTHQTICGDGSMIAKIESITSNGYGGLMIRETTDAGAKQTGIFTNLSNILRHEVRYTTNGVKQVNSFFRPSPIWLKLERQGDWVFAYCSSTDTSFQYVHGVYLPMQACVEIGLASFTYLPNAETEAVFSNVAVNGSSSGFGNEENNLETVLSKPSHIALNLLVYPNPNAGQFIVQLEQAYSSEIELEIYNLYGQRIDQKMVPPHSSSIKWNLGEVPAGTYFIRIKNVSEKQMVKQFIISY